MLNSRIRELKSNSIESAAASLCCGEYLPQEMAALTEDLSTRRGDPAAPEALRERVERTVPGDQAATLKALVDLWIVQYTFAAGMPVLEQPIDFVHISSNTPNGLDERATVETKVAGIQLGHFGSFYKTSWRANDWMWGRLDGAMRLTQIVLNPPGSGSATSGLSLEETGVGGLSIDVRDHDRDAVFVIPVPSLAADRLILNRLHIVRLPRPRRPKCRK